jgi:quinol monooxygenase YgiN
MLYEIYADRAAFDAHTKTEHYARFATESAALLASKSVVQCELVLEGSA